MAMVMKSSDDEREETQPIMSHFSHRHPLEASELHVDVGPAPPTCAPRPPATSSSTASAPTSPAHTLSLLPSPPYGDGEFTYHCGACEFDIHVECASLPEVEDRTGEMYISML
ncbi:hypothetical protein SASPL_113649 [Salvia splendens]|uniref:DC1 domain-containing protein n=1 Tax=Salvia splendens TaxID=180675 RepID=A0A8X8Y1Z7_SALSN|nr:uncharacterized protein LOC121803035 [Salvia splendens]KAG6423259.1 hypothetical protein SASPL_113649 [Salvia splendens]